MGTTEATPATANQNNNPFTSQPAGGMNLLGSPTHAAPAQASDDLLNLTGNPFVESVQSVMQMNNTVNNMQQQQPQFTPVWNNNTNMAQPSTGTSSYTVSRQLGFSSVLKLRWEGG